MLDRGPPLEVALVNAKTKSKPTQADILAQANLDGGGNTDADRRAKTPLPVLPKEQPRDARWPSRRRRSRRSSGRRKELLTQLQSAPVARAGAGADRGEPRRRSCRRPTS